MHRLPSTLGLRRECSVIRGYLGVEVWEAVADTLGFLGAEYVSFCLSPHAELRATHRQRAQGSLGPPFCRPIRIFIFVNEWAKQAQATGGKRVWGGLTLVWVTIETLSLLSCVNTSLSLSCLHYKLLSKDQYKQSTQKSEPGGALCSSQKVRFHIKKLGMSWGLNDEPLGFWAEKGPYWIVAMTLVRQTPGRPWSCTPQGHLGGVREGCDVSYTWGFQLHVLVFFCLRDGNQVQTLWYRWRSENQHDLRSRRKTAIGGFNGSWRYQRIVLWLRKNMYSMAPLERTNRILVVRGIYLIFHTSPRFYLLEGHLFSPSSL